MARHQKHKHVVVLIHGIRDHGLWQQEIRDTLIDAGFRVISTNYGRFDIIRFLLPFKWFRNKAVTTVLRQLNTAIYLNPGAEVSVIARSFGTYIIGRILDEQTHITLHRIILCGSILKFDFPFDRSIARFSRDIVNEVGTRDIWSALAESVTVGYGWTGTFGFNRPFGFMIDGTTVLNTISS